MANFIYLKTSLLIMAKAPGKIILFGEHFVVHGSYAIAASIDKYTEVEILETIDLEHPELKATFNGEEVRKMGHLYNAGINILNFLNLNKEISIKINSDILWGCYYSKYLYRVFV